MLTRLSQADSSKGQQVHTDDDGVNSSSKDMVKKCINNNLEDGNSIKATMATSSTRGNKKIQRPMHAQLKKAKAMVSTKVKSRKSLSCSC